MKMTLRFVSLVLAASLVAGQACAARLPKFGPYAVPLVEDTNYVRAAPAEDYWKLSQFYLPQQTSSACTLGSTAMALNFARGIPKYSDQTLITQNELLTTVFTGPFAAKVAEGGDGLKFDELVTVIKKGLKYYKLDRKYDVEVVRFNNASNASLNQLRQVLAANEASDDDVIVAYFNQGVLTSDWDGPHVSPLGAYNGGADQVLVMDVDRDWYVPYWSPDTKLLEALLRPAPADQGVLAGEVGGLVWIKSKD